MDDCFIRILELASYMKQCFIRFIEDLLFGGCESHYEVPRSGCHGRYFGTECEVLGVDCSLCPESVDVEIGRFTNVHDDMHVNGSSGTGCYLRRSQILLCHGLMLPLIGINLGFKLGAACVKYACLYVKNVTEEVSWFLYRVRRTLHGSTEDIGWLQRTDGLPPVEDGTDHFIEILQDIRNGNHSLPDTYVYLLIPGLFSNLSPLYFVNTKRCFSKMGLTSHIAKIHSEASVEKNAWVLKQYIEELYWGSRKKVMLLGHSKGGVDAAAALSMYWSDLKDKVAGLALVQSPYGGTPIASDILREGQIAEKEARRIMEFVVCKLIKGDMTALEDLTYDKRKDFIANHSFPSNQLPVISFHSEASLAPGVLATMSLIAHANLSDDKKLPVVMPLSAAMAISALHLKLRYGEASDGLVTRCDAEVPGSVAVRIGRRLDHAWMVCSTVTKDDVEADASEMCEALLAMVVEIGRRKEQSKGSV